MERCKVLIVEDEMLIRQGIINYIDWKSEGFEIIGEASNGEEALKIITQSPPHIVITDIVMPVMDGIELVKAIKRNYSGIEVIVLSSFEDFDYVRATFQNGVADYILKPELDIDKLLEALNQVVNKISGLYENDQSSPSELSLSERIKKKLLGYNIEIGQTVVSDYFHKNYYCLLSIYWKGEVSVQWDNLLADYFKDIIFLPIINEEERIIFLVNFDKKRLLSIKETLNKLAEYHQEIDSTVILLLSSPFQSLDEIKVIYDKDLQKIKQYMFYFPDRSLFIYDELPIYSENQKSFDLNYFIEVFKRKEFDLALEYLLDFVDYLSKQYMNDSFEFKSFLGNIIFNITVLMENINYDNQDIHGKKYKYLSDISEAENVKQVVEVFIQFLDEIKKIIYTTKLDNNEVNMQMIIDYIDNHYSEQIQLTDIANYFHYNPSYLSYYFSTHNTEGFSDYLKKIRIRKAKELLKSSKVPISDISSLVGYSEHSYFCRVFKIMTGMSPSRYRKEHHSQHENNFKKSH